MTDPQPSLPKAIQSQFAPVLRRDGFSGTGQRYWRLLGGQCQLVEIQGRRHGGKFAVNLGIQPMSVSLLSGEMPDPKRVREMECMFRKRLAVQNGDQWWDYLPNQQSMDSAAHDACVVYEQVGKRQLELMAEPDSPINTVTPEAFAARSFNFNGFRNTVVLMAWTLAHMRKATGNSIEARDFAQAALNEVGDGPGGSGLKAELRELLESAWGQHATPSTNFASVRVQPLSGRPRLHPASGWFSPKADIRFEAENRGRSRPL
jgi:hypothetical protein